MAPPNPETIRMILAVVWVGRSGFQRFITARIGVFSSFRGSNIETDPERLLCRLYRQMLSALAIFRLCWARTRDKLTLATEATFSWEKSSILLLVIRTRMVNRATPLSRTATVFRTTSSQRTG